MKYRSESSRSRRDAPHADAVQDGSDGGYAGARSRGQHLASLAKAGVLALIVAASTASLGALRTAAGGTSGTNGFAEVSRFLDNLATYLIYLAIPGGALGLIASGGMLLAGNPEGPKWLARSAIGVGVVLLAKGIMA
jgi:hypothetical protein